MYTPEHFAEDDVGMLHALMRAHSFAQLVTARAGEAPFATHLPLVLDAERGELGTLIGHVARANAHWRAFDGRTPALALFSGPHAYVSARWYPSARQVPTWNYVAVHASGAPHLVDDPGRAFELLRTLMIEHEGALPEAARALGKGPRELADIPFAHLDKLLRGIVAFELPIERLEGKRKLSQNKKPAERRALIAGLRAVGDRDTLALAELMQGTLGEEPPASEARGERNASGAGRAGEARSEAKPSGVEQ